MTSPRRDIVDPDEIGIYHCIARCVRRAFLCGFDRYTKRSYEHRKIWIRERLEFLITIFSIEVIAYAVMSNHLHTLIRTRPDIALTWSPREVARRWLMLFPNRHKVGLGIEPPEEAIAEIVADTELVETYRKRLASVSWFNRCLNENIAVRANREDDCTGRFWEGRFKCQRISDLTAIILCAVYIDLNLIRAGVAETPEESDHTSIQDRIHLLLRERLQPTKRWRPLTLLPMEDISEGKISALDYVRLVDCTGRQLQDKKHAMSEKAASVLERLRIMPEIWAENAQFFGAKFRRVVGPVSFFRELARRAGKTRFQGIRQASRLFSSQTPIEDAA